MKRQRILEEANPQRREYSSQKIKKENASHPERELPMSWVNSTKNYTKTMIKMSLDKNQVETKSKSCTDVQYNHTEERDKNPRDHD